MIEGSRGGDRSPEEDGRGEQDHRQGEQGGHQGDEGHAARAPQQAAGYFICLTLKMRDVNTFMTQCPFGEVGLGKRTCNMAATGATLFGRMTHVIYPL